MGTNDNLLDISKDAENLKGAEERFYKDQNGERVFRLSEEVDEEHEAERSTAMELEEHEEQYGNPEEFQEVQTPISSRAERSLHSPELTPLPATPSLTAQLQVRKGGRNVNEEYKDAVATVSYRTAMSIPRARIAVQAVIEKVCGKKLYLSVEEKNKFESPLEAIEEVEEEQPVIKRPRTKLQWEEYQDFLPSAKVCAMYKHQKATQK